MILFSDSVDLQCIEELLLELEEVLIIGSMEHGKLDISIEGGDLLSVDLFRSGADEV